jgi:NADH-quinone oxidoreductase subunit K
MLTITLQHYLTVAAILFTLGIFGIFLNRKNVIIILMSIELMLLAVNINLVAFSAHMGDLVGQVFAMFVLTVAAAEGRDRSRHPRRLFPQPRLDRRGRHQPDEGLNRSCCTPLPSSCR